MNLRRLCLFPVLFLGISNICNAASPKETFVKSVVKQCKISKEEAMKLVSPGRTGTVITFKLCPQKTMTLKNGCIITCGKEGASL